MENQAMGKPPPKPHCKCPLSQCLEVQHYITYWLFLLLYFTLKVPSSSLISFKDNVKVKLRVFITVKCSHKKAIYTLHRKTAAV